MTSVVVITPPAAPVLTAADLKVLQPVFADDSDALIDALVAAATKTIDGPSGWLGRALVNQTLEMRTRCFLAGGPLRLRYPPVSSVVSVKYIDTNGDEQTLTADEDYVVAGGDGYEVVTLPYAAAWPSTRWQEEAVKIRYVAGYGALGTSVPANIRYAVALMAGNLRSMSSADARLRSETVDGVGSRTFTDAQALYQAFDGTVQALLAPMRVFA